MDWSKIHKSNKARNVFIVILLIVIGVLLTGNRLDESTKKYFFFIGIPLILLFIAYQWWQEKNNQIDVSAIGRKIINFEFQKSGRKMSLRDMYTATSDSSNILFEFSTGDKVLTYKYNTDKKYISDIREKDIAGVLDEMDKREVLKKIALENIEKEKIRKEQTLQGFEYEEDE